MGYRYSYAWTCRLRLPGSLALGLQVGQTRSYLQTLDPKVGIVEVLGALGYIEQEVWKETPVNGHLIPLPPPLCSKSYHKGLLSNCCGVGQQNPEIRP